MLVEAFSPCYGALRCPQLPLQGSPRAFRKQAVVTVFTITPHIPPFWKLLSNCPHKERIHLSCLAPAPQAHCVSYQTPLLLLYFLACRKASFLKKHPLKFRNRACAVEQTVNRSWWWMCKPVQLLDMQLLSWSCSQRKSTCKFLFCFIRKWKGIYLHEDFEFLPTHV